MAVRKSIHTIAIVLIALGAAKSAGAQLVSNAFELPLAPTDAEKRGPERPNAERNRNEPPGAVTYSGESSENGRALHYHLASIDPRSDSEALDASKPERDVASRAVDDGNLVPYTISARVRKGLSWVRVVGGYDSASGSARARSAAETAATSWLAIRVEYQHSTGSGFGDHVGLGGRVQLFDQKRHGIDLGFVALYQPKDFRDEGNVVGGLMFGRRFGRLGLFGSALIGSDPEGDDQDTDERVSLLYRATDLFSVGVDNRFHYVLSTDSKRFGTIVTDWELQLEPTVIINLGPLAVLSEAGLSALQNTGPIGMLDNRRIVHTGMIAMAGAAAAF